MDLPTRKHPRLKTFDYSQPGCYHLTICTNNHQPVLSRVIPAKNTATRAIIQLSNLGQIVDRYIQNIPSVYPGVSLDKYVVMPNHVHLLILLTGDSTVSVPTIVRSLKRMVTRESGQSIWQDSYYDVIIKNDSMYWCEWSYIDNNPDKWVEDKLFVENI